MDNNESDHVTRMFAAISRGDMPAFKACFAPGALIWHNDDEKEQDVDTVAALLGHLCASSTSVTYKEQRIVHCDDVLFVQHILTAPLKTGGELRLPAIMRIGLADDGRVARIEEYYDSRATDCLK
jgi:ketosteroid isomerase-like protein